MPEPALLTVSQTAPLHFCLHLCFCFTSVFFLYVFLFCLCLFVFVYIFVLSVYFCLLFSFHISFANASLFLFTSLFFFHVSLLLFIFCGFFVLCFVVFVYGALFLFICLFFHFVFIEVNLFWFTLLCFCLHRFVLSQHIFARPSLSVTSSDLAQSVQTSRLTLTSPHLPSSLFSSSHVSLSFLSHLCLAFNHRRL